MVITDHGSTVATIALFLPLWLIFNPSQQKHVREGWAGLGALTIIGGIYFARQQINSVVPENSLNHSSVQATTWPAPQSQQATIWPVPQTTTQPAPLTQQQRPSPRPLTQRQIDDEAITYMLRSTQNGTYSPLQ